MRALILAALLFAAPAHALTWQEFTRTPEDSTVLHAAILVDDFAYGGIAGAYSLVSAAQGPQLASLERAGFGRLVSQLRRGGIEVHTYTYSQMYKDPDKWAVMGSPRSSGGGGYALTLCPGWLLSKHGGQASQRFANDLYRFTRADQTTTHLIHWGGDQMQWADNYTTTTDSTLAVGATLGNILDGSGGVANTQLAVAATGDSIWLSRYMWGQARVDWVGANYRVEGLLNLLKHYPPRDSIRAEADSLAVGWRVRHIASGKYTDFVLTTEPYLGSGYQTAHIVWALAVKWVRVPEIPLLFSMADYAEWGHDPFWHTRPSDWNSGNTAQYRRPSASGIASVLNEMRTTWGVEHVAMGTMPDSATRLWNADPAYASHRNLAGVEWAMHWHTSDTTSQFGFPLGAQVSNFDTTFLSLRPGLRVANRRDPSASVGLKWGVAQMLAVQDSVLRAQGLHTSRFMLPGNDGLMNPSTWRDYRTGVTRCPAESLFVALANAGKTLIANSPGIGVAGNYPRVSNAGTRWPLGTEEIYRTSDGREVRFTSYAVISADWGSAGNPADPGPLTILEACQLSQPTLNRLLGFTANTYGINYPATSMGQTIARTKNIDDGRARVFGTHVNYIEPPGPGQVGDYYAWQVTCFKPLKALEAIAGHRLHRWGTPEEVFMSRL